MNVTQNIGRRHTAIVAGGAGFLGSHLSERLVTLGFNVIVVDNLVTGSLHNLDHLKGKGELTVVKADIAERLLLDAQAHFIFNLACPASPVHYQADPIATMKTSVIGTLKLLELAEALGARLIQASTSEVYGDPLQHPQIETDWGNVNPIGIRSCYDEGKRAAETLCFDFQRTRGTEVRVARIFNTYGPHMRDDDGRVVSNFITQALQGGPITIYGDGSQTRSFCYVDDLIDGLVALALHEKPSPLPFNLGNPNEITLVELADMVRELTGTNCEVVFRPLPLDDPRRRCPDISRAKELLRWEPKIALRQGLSATINYFANRLQMANRSGPRVG